MHSAVRAVSLRIPHCIKTGLKPGLQQILIDLLQRTRELTSLIGFKKPMHGKGIRNNCFTVLIYFYSLRGNNGSIDTFVGFSSLKTFATATTSIDANGNFQLAYSNSDFVISQN